MLPIMNSKRIIRTGIVLALAAVSAVSCVTNRKVAYLQDMKHGSQIELENKFEAVISPYDELDIIITCFDTDLARPFNIRSVDAGNMNSNVGAIAQVMKIARKTGAVAIQNRVLALGVKLAVILLGLIGFANIWLAIFADTGVAMLCVINTLKLLRANKN